MHIYNQIDRDVIERSSKIIQNKSKYTIKIVKQANMQNTTQKEDSMQRMKI